MISKESNSQQDKQKQRANMKSIQVKKVTMITDPLLALTSNNTLHFPRKRKTSERHA